MTHVDIGDARHVFCCTFELLHDVGNLVRCVVSYWNHFNVQLVHPICAFKNYMLETIYSRVHPRGRKLLPFLL